MLPARGEADLHEGDRRRFPVRCFAWHDFLVRAGNHGTRGGGESPCRAKIGDGCKAPARCAECERVSFANGCPRRTCARRSARLLYRCPTSISSVASPQVRALSALRWIRCNRQFGWPSLCFACGTFHMALLRSELSWSCCHHIWRHSCSARCFRMGAFPHPIRKVLHVSGVVFSHDSQIILD